MRSESDCSCWRPRSCSAGWRCTPRSSIPTGFATSPRPRTIDQGSLAKGFVHSVDHPVYPLAIVAVHRLIGGDGPRDWQRAAQLAAVISGVLLVHPALPDRTRALRRFAGLDILPVYLPCSVQRARSGRCTFREHVPALLVRRGLVELEAAAHGEAALAVADRDRAARLRI